MKILYHHRTKGDGAEGVHVAEIISEFEKLGHEVYLACPRSARRKPGLTSQQSESLKSKILNIPPFVRQLLEIIYNVVSFMRIWIAATVHRPDFMYERYATYNAGGVKAASLKKIPIILEVNCTHTGRFPSSFPVAFPKTLKWSERYTLRSADGLIAVSEPLKACICDVVDRKNRVIVSPNAINSETIAAFDYAANRKSSRGQLGIEHNVVIGFVGSLRIWHGIDFLADAIPKLLERHPDAHLLIVGTGECLPLLQKIKELHHMQNRITMTGGVPHADIYRWISAMDIGLMPDSNDYGSPMKILEYMAMRCVPVGPNLKPIEEIIDDGRTGLLFEQRNIDSFIEVISEIIDTPKKMKEIGIRARSEVLHHRTWRHNAEHAIRLHEELLQRDG